MPSKNLQAKPFEIKSSFGFHLSKILQLKRRLIDAELKDLGLSRSQWRVLLWLRILGPCTQKMLLQELDTIDAAHLTRVLAQFEEAGFIARERVPGNRRTLFIQVTPKGHKQLLPRLEQALLQENKILIKGFSKEDKSALQRLFVKMESNLMTALSTQGRDHD